MTDDFKHAKITGQDMRDHWGPIVDRIADEISDTRDARITALEAENERLREALRKIEQGVPRSVGKSWRVDGRPSKHDECIHGIWMYEVCEGCTDAFIAAALGETK